jgi:4-hydroxybenzoate polyprenyltransferase
MSLYKAFIKYQANRFPLKILGFTTLASVLSSAAILNYEVNIWLILAAYFAILFLMFHIRVVDESRDFTTDSINRKDHPIHTGIIGLKQLIIIDIIGIVIVITLSILNGINALIILGLFLLFTAVAWKNFFLGEYFKGKNILYHLVNSPQMIILQLYIFTLYTGNVKYSSVMWMLVLFIYLNIFILEVVRKIKISKEDSKVKDTYSSSIGYRKSILFLYFLSISSFIVYFLLMNFLDTSTVKILISILPLFLLLTFSILFHLKRKSKLSEKILLLSTVLQYVGLNAFICLFQL